MVGSTLVETGEESATTKKSEEVPASAEAPAATEEVPAMTETPAKSLNDAPTRLLSPPAGKAS